MNAQSAIRKENVSIALIITILMKKDQKLAQLNQLMMTLQEFKKNKIVLDIKKTGKNHNACLFGCENIDNLRRLSKEECANIFVKTDIYVPYGNKICNGHDTNYGINIPENFALDQPNSCMNLEEVKSLLYT